MNNAIIITTQTTLLCLAVPYIIYLRSRIEILNRIDQKQCEIMDMQNDIISKQDQIIATSKKKTKKLERKESK